MYMTTRIINELKKRKFINIMTGNIPTLPHVPIKDRYSIRVKKQVYYEGEIKNGFFHGFGQSKTKNGKSGLWNRGE